MMICDVKGGCNRYITPIIKEHFNLDSETAVVTFGCQLCGVTLSKVLKVRRCDELLEERKRLSKNFATQMRTLELAKANTKLIKRAEKRYKSKQELLKKQQETIYNKHKEKYKEHLEW